MGVASATWPGKRSLGSMRANPTAAWRHVDLVMVGCTLATAMLGSLMVFSATRGNRPDVVVTSFVLRQLVFVIIGLGVMAVTTFIDYRRFRDLALVGYGAVVLGLFLVISPLGTSSNGAQAWFELGSFQLQPSEFAKLIIIVTVAALLAQYQGDIDMRRLIVLLFAVGVPFGLIMMQPDLGTGLVFISITMGLLLVGGVRARHIVVLTLFGLMGVVFVLNSDVLAKYQKDRLTTFLNPEENTQEAAYNLDQSKIAIGAGGFAGEGLFHGSQTRLNIVPEQHTDFIFTAVGEELGFVGGATLLVLFSIMAWRMWRTAQLARDPLGSLICVGILSMFVFQIFENVGMTMGIMPITGIPLPFMSYGGSNTLMAFASIGLILNVHMRRFS